MPNPFIHEASKSESRLFGEVVQALAVALIFNIVVYFLFIIPSQVDGPSMMPNLLDKELLFANKTPSWFSGSPATIKQLGWDYQRGDIVIFDFLNMVLVKRVIGVPGDRIMINNDGDVYLNGTLLYEPFLPAGLTTLFPQASERAFEPGQEFTVPEDKFFVMGDHRDNSKDSRFSEVGFIPRTKIKGVVFFRFYPLDKIGTISRPAAK